MLDKKKIILSLIVIFSLNILLFIIVTSLPHANDAVYEQDLILFDKPNAARKG